MDGPSSSGVYVSVSKGHVVHEHNLYDFVTPSSERTVEAVEGIASFPELRVKATGNNLYINTVASFNLSSSGLDAPKGFDRPSAIMANWYTETYREDPVPGYTIPDTTNNKPHETITVKIRPRIFSSRIPDWFNHIYFVTVNDEPVDWEAMEKELIDGEVLSLDIDTSKVPELQVAGSHTICVYAIEGQHLGRIIGGWYPESFLIQTIEPGAPYSIQVVQQPEDQTQRGESIEVKVEVRDRGGNLTPAFVRAQPANPDQWSLGGTTGVNAGDGQATFTIHANSNIYNDEMNEIRFIVDVDGGEIIQLSDPFYVLAKQRD